MVSFLQMKKNIRIRIKGMVDAADTKQIPLKQTISLMCLDYGFTDKTVLGILEMMEDIGEILVEGEYIQAVKKE